MDLLFTCQHGNRGLVNQTGPRVKLLKEQAVLQVSLVFKTQWLFVRDRMRTYTGNSSCTTKLRVFLRKMKEKEQVTIEGFEPGSLA